MDVTSMFSLDGRTALITGGSRGIGRMIAEGYVRSGVRTYISSRKAPDCDATAEELSAFGHCVSLPADVSSQEGIADLVARYRQHEGSLTYSSTTQGPPGEPRSRNFPSPAGTR